MVLPKAINKLFDDSLRSSDTTILIPRLAESRHHYQDNQRIFYSDDLGIKILSPEGWTVSAGSEKDAADNRGTLSNRTRSISILLNKETLFRPKINLMLEDIGDVNFMDYFHHRLNSLRRCGIQAVKYHIDENFQIVTFQLLQTTARGAQLFGLQKYFLRKGKAYTITVSDLNPEYIEKEPKLVRDITQVIQSFAFVEFI
jgi:hypothetical protein